MHCSNLPSSDYVWACRCFLVFNCVLWQTECIWTRSAQSAKTDGYSGVYRCVHVKCTPCLLIIIAHENNQRSIIAATMSVKIIIRCYSFSVSMQFIIMFSKLIISRSCMQAPDPFNGFVPAKFIYS